MARGLGGLTALRAALGGVAGGLQGLGEMREARRLQEQQALAAERQRAMDELAMLNQGFMRVEDMAGERHQTGQALSRALSSAAAMMRPGGMAGGAAPSLQQGDLRRMAEAPGMESPQQRVTLGGATYQRESPTAAALRRAELETARERMAGEQKTAQERAAREQNVTAAMSAYKLTRPQAEEFVRTGKSPFVEAQAPMTEAQRVEARQRDRTIALAEQKASQTAEGKPRFGEVSSLRKEFNVESRPYKTINDALKNIETLGAKANPTPQDDQALIYQFVKAQDPTSVVRESEYANAASAIALTDRITSYAQRLQTGQKLTTTQRADMVRTARLLREEAMSQYRSLADSYESLASSFGMNPKTIVPNRLDAVSQKEAGTASEDAVYDEAARAISLGADPKAVRARYEKATGKKWPGA